MCKACLIAIVAFLMLAVAVCVSSCAEVPKKRRTVAVNVERKVYALQLDDEEARILKSMIADEKKRRMQRKRRK